MSEELRECPFCNHDALIVAYIHHRHGTKIYHGECNVCGAESKACDSKEEAIKAWNTRPAEDALKAENQRLEDTLTYIEELTFMPENKDEILDKVWDIARHNGYLI